MAGVTQLLSGLLLTDQFPTTATATATATFKPVDLCAPPGLEKMPGLTELETEALSQCSTMDWKSISPSSTIPMMTPKTPSSPIKTKKVSGAGGSAGELPSAGSAGHRKGRCKPCAFIHTEGCSNGSACPFCHLCPPGEKQRRKKELKALRKARAAAAAATSGETERKQAGEDSSEDESTATPGSACS